jgi:hypothetical protein
MDDRRHTLLATDKRLMPVTGEFSSRVDRTLVDFEIGFLPVQDDPLCIMPGNLLGWQPTDRQWAKLGS